MTSALGAADVFSQCLRLAPRCVSLPVCVRRFMDGGIIPEEERRTQTHIYKWPFQWLLLIFKTAQSTSDNVKVI